MSTEICDSCFNEFDKCICDWADEEFGDHLFEVDRDIQPAISILNQKGYKTRFSCSGHSENNFSNAYICFDRPYQFDKLPEGWRYDYFTYRGIKKEYRHVIRPWSLHKKEIDRMDELELDEHLDRVNENLIFWAKELEQCCARNILPIVPKSKYEKYYYKLSITEGIINYYPPYLCD